MKRLLDENLPVKLKYRFRDAGLEAFTVRDMKWFGKTNGELLKLLLDNKFTAFITIDNNLQFQQNFVDYPIQVLVIVAPDNTYETIMEIFPPILVKINEPNKNVQSVFHPSLAL